MAYTNAIFFIDLVGGSDSARTALTTCIASNPSGTITRITKNGHGLITGAVVDLTFFTAWLNSAWKITYVDENNFDLDGAVWEATADASGTVTPRGGSSWADAWLTCVSGATAAKIQAGDTIRFKKSDDASSQASCSFTYGSKTVTLNSALNITVDNCESHAAWTASANVTLSTEATIIKEGSGSVKAVIATAFTTGIIFYKDYGSADWSGYTGIGFWIRSSLAQSAGRLRLLVDDTSGCVSPLETLALPALVANQWHYVYLPFATPANLTAVVSIALDAGVDPGAPSIYIDNIILYNGFHGADVIGDTENGTMWYPIDSIDGTTVTLAAPYIGTTGSKTLYYRRPLESSAAPISILDSGTSSSALITYSGGWNSTSGLQDGLTLVAGLNKYSTALFILLTAHRAFIYLEKIIGFFYQNFLASSNTITISSSTLKDTGINGSIATTGAAIFTKGDLIIDNFNSAGCTNTPLIFNTGAATVGLGANTIVKNSKVSGSGAYGLETLLNTPIRIQDCGFYYNVKSGLFISGCVLAKNVETDGNTTSGLHIEPDSTASAWQENGKRIFNNCEFKEATPITSTVPIMSIYDFYAFRNYQKTSGDHRRYYRYGYTKRNTAASRSGDCLELIPSDATGKLQIFLGKFLCTASVQLTLSVYMKKSADYNGNNPRIGVIQDMEFIADLTVCAITESYVQYTINATPAYDGAVELYIDCDGTVGSIYIDDIECNSISHSLSCWADGFPALIATGGSGGMKIIGGGLIHV